jgi:endonuclease/exonuclease/phosphatase family metal-dependent hydrolase
MRVVSYNIRHGVGADGRLDLQRTADTIAAAGADLVGLQEVDRHFSARSGFVDQAGWLGERLGMHVAFGANLDLEPPEPGRPRRQYGNAALAVPEVLGWLNVPLPGPAGTEPRGLLEALVVVDGGPLRFLVTHLQNRSQPARLAQVDVVRGVVTGRPSPAVLAGDLNARPGSAEVRRLTAVAEDAWAAAGRGRGHTFPATAPAARIDYVLATPDLVATAAAVIDSRASDHRPVRADLESAGRVDAG